MQCRTDAFSKGFILQKVHPMKNAAYATCNEGCIKNAALEGWRTQPRKGHILQLQPTKYPLKVATNTGWCIWRVHLLQSKGNSKADKCKYVGLWFSVIYCLWRMHPMNAGNECCLQMQLMKDAFSKCSVWMQCTSAAWDTGCCSQQINEWMNAAYATFIGCNKYSI